MLSSKPANSGQMIHRRFRQRPPGRPTCTPLRNDAGIRGIKGAHILRQSTTQAGSYGQASHCCWSPALDTRLGAGPSCAAVAGSQSARARQPGTGRSGKPPGTYSIRQMAEDALSVLTAHGAVPAHIVGASMGGYIAITLAKYHPEAVRSLVLIATTIGGLRCRTVPEETLLAWQRASNLDAAGYATRAECSSPGIALTRSAECNPSKGAHDGERRGAPS